MSFIHNPGSSGSSGSGIDAAARSAVTATQAEVDALEVSQTTQDALITASATKVELAALQTLVTANIDKAVITVDRQVDQSLLVTYDDATTETIAAATGGAVAETDPIYASDKGAIDAHLGDTIIHVSASDKALLHDGVAQDTAIADEITNRTDADTVEKNERIAADALKIDKTDVQTTIRDSVTALDTKVPSEKAVRSLFETLSVAGDYIGSSVTFAGLPTTSTAKTATNGDWSVLTADDGVNKKGVYLYDGTNYVFAFTLQANTSTLADFADGAANLNAPLTHEPGVIKEVIALGSSWHDATTGAFDADTLLITNPARLVGFDETATLANMIEGHTTGMSGFISVSGDKTTGKAFAFVDNHVSTTGLGIWSRKLTAGVWGSWLRFSDDAWIETDLIVGTLTVPLGSKVILAAAKQIQLSTLGRSDITSVRIVPRTQWSDVLKPITVQTGWTVQDMPKGGTQEIILVPNHTSKVWEAKIVADATKLPSIIYQNGEVLTETSERVLTIPSNFIGEATPNQQWAVLVAAGTAPTIANGANLLNAITANQITLIGPEQNGSNQIIAFNTNGITFALDAFKLDKNQYIDFYSTNSKEQELLLGVKSDANFSVFVNGQQIGEGFSSYTNGVEFELSNTNVLKIKTHHARVYQNFRDGDVSGQTHIKTNDYSGVMDVVDLIDDLKKLNSTRIDNQAYIIKETGELVYWNPTATEGYVTGDNPAAGRFVVVGQDNSSKTPIRLDDSSAGSQKRFLVGDYQEGEVQRFRIAKGASVDITVSTSTAYLDLTDHNDPQAAPALPIPLEAGSDYDFWYEYDDASKTTWTIYYKRITNVGETVDYITLFDAAPNGSIQGYTWQEVKDTFEQIHVTAMIGANAYPLGTINAETIVSNMIVREGHADSSRWSLNFGAISSSTFTTGVAGLGTITRLVIKGVKKTTGIQFVKKDDVIPVEDLGNVEFLIGEFRPTQGGNENPADTAGEIRGTGSTFTTGINLTTVEKIEIVLQERTGQRRQWSEVIDLKATFDDGQPKALSSPYDVWHVNIRVTNEAAGNVWFSETNVNANLVSIRAYGKKTIKNVMSSAIEVDTTGIADGDALVWDAANNKFVKGSAATPSGTDKTFNITGAFHNMTTEPLNSGDVLRLTADTGVTASTLAAWSADPSMKIGSSAIIINETGFEVGTDLPPDGGDTAGGERNIRNGGSVVVFYTGEASNGNRWVANFN